MSTLKQSSGTGRTGSTSGGSCTVSSQQTSSGSSSSPVIIKSQGVHSVNEIYKNFVQPVLVPFHYCCTPLLFYPNWHDTMITENMLKVCDTKFVY